ncbi:hypothetical protein [Metabacillus fastidiosus]
MILEILSFVERTIKAIEIMKLYNNAVWWGEREEKDLEKMLS